VNICVFCGSARGADDVYQAAARELGVLLASSGHSLVYGGGNIGLMGLVADAMMETGGRVTGIIPDFLFQREVGHRGISELIVVGSMHERKARMASIADAFIALPGGLGTLDELAEILTWKQLGLIHQPVVLLNIKGFFDHLLKQIDVMVEQGFVSHTNREHLTVVSSPEAFLQFLKAYRKA